MTPKLSILICGLEERRDILNRLLMKLKLISFGLPVEVIDCVDDRQMPTGKKRNTLIADSSGEYVAFVDDDDDVETEYARMLLAAIESHPDCVGIIGTLHLRPPIKGIETARFIHSIQCPEWYVGFDGTYYRMPNHLNPVRRELAEEVGFNDFLTVGEDYDYSRRLKPLLKTEVMLAEPIYHYNWDTSKDKPE
jgi:cellulose synthase/poly-beta-1,6-N-acetylglucosamine synthase-like glycosyltransferase